jgi:pimeloyl-ACP methyl ester carboxylesterase
MAVKVPVWQESRIARRHARQSDRRPPSDASAAHSRVAVRATAGQDLLARTIAGLATSMTMLPTAWRPEILRHDARAIDFYIAAGRSHDPDVLFRAPTELPDVSARAVARHRLTAGVEIVEKIRFPSTYVPANPLMRERYGEYRRNGYAWLQHWRHGDGPRPTVIVVHGFSASAWTVNSAFFSMPWYYHRGYDVALMTLPFHGRRREAGSRYDGSGLFSHGLAHTVEGIAHGVHDIRSFMSHLFASGVDQVGITGLSLGGYTSALLAETDDRLAFSIPIAAPTHFVTMAALWWPNGPLLRRMLPRNGISMERFSATLDAHSPLTYPARLPKDRLLLIGGLGDRLVPPGEAARLWEHWGRPRMHWYDGNHVVHVGQRAYSKVMAGFLDDIGFSASAKRTGGHGGRLSMRRARPA